MANSTNNPYKGRFNGIVGNAKGAVTDRSGDRNHDAPTQVAAGKLYERVLVSTQGTGTRYVAAQGHEWTPDEINAVYILPDKPVTAPNPGEPLKLVNFVVEPDFAAAKHPEFPLQEERAKLAPEELKFLSSHTCRETTLTESHLDVHEVAGREGERIHFTVTLRRKS